MNIISFFLKFWSGEGIRNNINPQSSRGLPFLNLQFPLKGSYLDQTLFYVRCVNPLFHAVLAPMTIKWHVLKFLCCSNSGISITKKITCVYISKNDYNPPLCDPLCSARSICVVFFGYLRILTTWVWFWPFSYPKTHGMSLIL